MSGHAGGSGAALAPQARVDYDPVRSIGDLKATLRAVRELCETSSEPLAVRVLAILDGKAG